MNINPLFNNTIRKGLELINYQSVRWRRPRKPFWLGLAKSKMFVIREKKSVMTPEEQDVYNELTSEYKIHYDSILKFICSESPRCKVLTSAEGNELKLSPALEEKIALSFKINEEWSEESRKLGEEWSERNLEMEAEKAKALSDANNLEKEKHMEMLNEIIRKEKALSSTYITPENLDEVIENSLKNVEEFDFAIDLQGNKYYGRKSLENVSDEVSAKESAIFAEESSDNTVQPQ